MIANDVLKKIDALFRTLQMLSCPSVQMYDSEQEYRCYYLFAKGLDWKKDCSSAHINFPLDKVRPWHLKNWDKRKKLIAAVSFVEEMPGENIIRFGFK